MKLIDELFKKYTLKEETLIDYGFSFNNGIYTYNKLIYNGSFELQLLISNNKLDGKLIDKDFNEEYNLINVDSSGAFLNSLKEECVDILIDIRNKCFNKEAFIFPQSNRIANLIKDKYNVSPEYLWDTNPGFGVFRNYNTFKWFGIIMNIPKNKITGNDKKEIEALNVMLHDKTDEALNMVGIYPAYHMNKKNWVSIILDDTLEDNDIMYYINISYELSKRK